MVYHEQGSQDLNNVKTKVETSSVHRETVASTIRVAPASSKSSGCGSGGGGDSSNPTSTHPKPKSIHIETRIPKVDRIWTTFLDTRNAKGFHLRLASPSASRTWFDTMTKTNEKQIGMLYFLY